MTAPRWSTFAELRADPNASLARVLPLPASPNSDNQSGMMRFPLLTLLLALNLISALPPEGSGRQQT